MNLTVKIICGIAAIIVCTFVGYKLADKYRLRRDFFCGFYNFNQKMIEEVNFSRNSLFKIINSFTTKNEFKKLLNEYMTNIKENSLNLKAFYYLTDEEKSIITTYFQSLGKSDAETELKNLNSVVNRLKDSSKTSIIEEKKYKVLYIKLGFLCGLMIFVILI